MGFLPFLISLNAKNFYVLTKHLNCANCAEKLVEGSVRISLRSRLEAQIMKLDDKVNLLAPVRLNSLRANFIAQMYTRFSTNWCACMHCVLTALGCGSSGANETLFNSVFL